MHENSQKLPLAIREHYYEKMLTRTITSQKAISRLERSLQKIRSKFSLIEIFSLVENFQSRNLFSNVSLEKYSRKNFQ